MRLDVARSGSGCLLRGAEGGRAGEGWSLKLRFFCCLPVWMCALAKLSVPTLPHHGALPGKWPGWKRRWSTGCVVRLPTDAGKPELS